MNSAAAAAAAYEGEESLPSELKKECRELDENSTSLFYSVNLLLLILIKKE